MDDPVRQRKLAVHGPVVALDYESTLLDAPIDALLGKFTVSGWPERFVPATGSIRSYDADEVLRRLSLTARHLTRMADMADVYEEAERFWLVDDRWGMAEINVLRGQWRSWILPQPKLDPLRVAELAVLWPMAQILRPRGVHLLPAVSVVRDGFAVLMICPFGVEPELAAMIAGGYKVIGQRWTAVREEDGRLALLHVPGRVERSTSPRLRSTVEPEEAWLDLAAAYPSSWQNHAFCDAVLVVEPGRRAKGHLRHTKPADAINLLRSVWPILELHPNRRLGQLPSKLAQACPCFELQLSRNSKDLLALLNSLRYSTFDGDEQSAAA